MDTVIQENKNLINRFMTYKKVMNVQGNTVMLAIATVAFEKIKNETKYPKEVEKLWRESFKDVPLFGEMLDIKKSDNKEG